MPNIEFAIRMRNACIETSAELADLDPTRLDAHALDDRPLLLYDAPYNGNPNVGYVKRDDDAAHVEPAESGHRDDTAFGFRFERLPNPTLKAKSSQPTSSLSISTGSGSTTTHASDMLDETTSAHPAATARMADRTDDEDIVQSLFVSMKAPDGGA